MNREERRRQDREARRQQQRMRRVEVAPDRVDAAREDFLAGGAFAAGAALLIPTDRPSGAVSSELPATFAVLLDDNAFRVAPALRELFAELDHRGTETVNEELRGTLRWSAFPHPKQSLVKLSLTLTAPVEVDVDLVLIADLFAETLWAAARGGLVGLTTSERLETAAGGSYTDSLEKCVVIDAPPSAALRELLEARGWPTGPASNAASVDDGWPQQAHRLLGSETIARLVRQVAAVGDCGLCQRTLGEGPWNFSVAVAAQKDDSGTLLRAVPVHRSCGSPSWSENILIIAGAPSWGALGVVLPTNGDLAASGSASQLPALLVNPSNDVLALLVDPDGQVKDQTLAWYEEHGFTALPVQLGGQSGPFGAFVDVCTDREVRVRYDGGEWTAGSGSPLRSAIEQCGGILVLIFNTPLVDDLFGQRTTAHLLMDAMRSNEIRGGWAPLPLRPA